MGRPPKNKKESIAPDLNQDGKFDKQDKTIAAQALNKPVGTPVVSKAGERTLAVDLSLTLRKGMKVSASYIAERKAMGFDMSDWFVPE